MTEPSIAVLRRTFGALFLLAIATICAIAHAEEIPVPIDLQATLLSKVVSYDRNLSERAGDKVRTLLVGKSSDPTSMPFVRQMRQMLGAIESFGSFSHTEEIVEFASAAALLDKCRNERISIVYLGPGLHDDVEPIRAALEPLSILTVSANPDDVPRGIVLGFDLVYGKPKLVVNLGQARKQRVDLVAVVLKLMRVIGI
ncbi:MAG: YfiR family protein [Polyangiaceae bacterium]